MRFRADFHIHTDYSTDHGWHGEKPQVVAKALYNSSLDVAAVLEHNRITERYNDVREEFAYLQDIEKIKTNTVRELMILLGCEISCVFHGFQYHIGFIHELPYKRNDLPEPPRIHCSLEEIEEYKKAYPGITIVFHPAWRDHTYHSQDATKALMESGIIDGAELLNGSIFDNMQRHSNGSKKGEVQKWFRNFEFALEVYNKAKEKLSKEKIRIAAIGSSDAHRAKMIGTMYTEFQSRRKENVFQEVRRGTTISVCATNGQIREKVKELIGKNNSGRYIKVLRNPMKY